MPVKILLQSVVCSAYKGETHTKKEKRKEWMNEKEKTKKKRSGALLKDMKKCRNVAVDFMICIRTYIKWSS